MLGLCLPRLIFTAGDPTGRHPAWDYVEERLKRYMMNRNRQMRGRG